MPNLVTYPPYDGVSGITTRQEIIAIHDGVSDLLTEGKIIQLGMLANEYTLYDLEMPERFHPKRHTPLSVLREISQRSFPVPSTLFGLHFWTQHPQSLDEQVLQILSQAPLFDLIQLNGNWPEVGHVQRIYAELMRLQDRDERPRRLVLQVNHASCHPLGRDASGLKSIAQQVLKYRGAITDVLVDLSGGEGKPFDPVFSRELLRALQDECGEAFVYGIAGGLHAGNTDLVDQVSVGHKRPSTDAEGKLRDAQDELVVPEVISYLRKQLDARQQALAIAS